MKDIYLIQSRLAHSKVWDNLYAVKSELQAQKDLVDLISEQSAVPYNVRTFYRLSKITLYD